MEKQFTQDYVAKIEKLMEEETVLEALAKATDKADVVKVFAENDVEMDEDIAQEIYTKVHAIGENGELDADMLDAVNGGVITELGAAVMIGAGIVTFYITVKVGCWIVKKIFK